MLSGDFERKLRILNRELRIFCGNDDSKPAGIYHVVRGEYTEICGCDKNWLPEYVQYNEDGSIRRGGWRRVLKILINKDLIDRKEAEKVFQTHLEYKGAQRVLPKRPNVAEAANRFGLSVTNQGVIYG
jgi:hypothetical protein